MKGRTLMEDFFIDVDVVERVTYLVKAENAEEAAAKMKSGTFVGLPWSEQTKEILWDTMKIEKASDENPIQSEVITDGD